MITRRSAFAIAAASLAAPIAAFAQTAGIPSTTAQSNSEGTPASNTGVVSTTRVGPAMTAPTPRAVRRRRHRHHHHAAATTAE